MKKNILLFLILGFLLTGCAKEITTAPSIEYSPAITSSVNTEKTDSKDVGTNNTSSIDNILEYLGNPYIEVSATNISFTDNLTEEYGPLDSLERCTYAKAIVSKETMPAVNERRGDISSIKPTGWQSIKYDCVEGESLYNRSHLLGWQLTAENANEKNLVTGTRYFNLAMEYFENQIAGYVKDTGHTVYVEAVPDFRDSELVCRGLYYRAFSIEDNSISIDVYIFNVQPGIEIDYKTGKSSYNGVFLDCISPGVNHLNEVGNTYVLNVNKHKIHKPECSAVSNMADYNKKTYIGYLDELIEHGYEPCKLCNPK